MCKNLALVALLLLTGTFVVGARLTERPVAAAVQAKMPPTARTSLVLRKSPPRLDRVSFEKLLDGLWEKEAGHQLYPQDGDAGRAIGPLQLWHAYWWDATHDIRGHKIHSGSYQDCRKLAYARQVVRWFCQRYEPAATRTGNWAVLASLHHLGPDWRDRPRRAAVYVCQVRSILSRNDESLTSRCVGASQEK